VLFLHKFVSLSLAPPTKSGHRSSGLWEGGNSDYSSLTPLVNKHPILFFGEKGGIVVMHVRARVEDCWFFFSLRRSALS